MASTAVLRSVIFEAFAPIAGAFYALVHVVGFRIAEVSARIGDLSGNVAEQFGDLNRSVRERFVDLNHHLDDRFGQVDKRLDRVVGHIHALAGEMATIRAAMAGVDARLATIASAR